MAGEFDLRIVNGDLSLGLDDEPQFIAGADVVVQDLGTRLRVSGLLPELVADDDDPSGTLTRIALEVEKDERIKPGTAKAEQAEPGTIRVTARLVEGAPFALELRIPQ